MVVLVVAAAAAAVVLLLLLLVRIVVPTAVRAIPAIIAIIAMHIPVLVTTKIANKAMRIPFDMMDSNL